MKKYIFTLSAIICSLGYLKAQDSLGTPDQLEGFEITATITGLTEGQEVKFAMMEGINSTIKQTQLTDANGTVTFKGPERQPGGFYYIVLPSQKYFQVIVDQDQHFSVSTDTLRLDKLSFEGSPDNQLMLDFVKNSIRINKEWQAEKKLRDEEEKDSKKYEKHQDRMNEINQEAIDTKASLFDNHPDALYTLLLKASEKIIPPLAPDSIEDPGDKNLWRFSYYKYHFWDNIDLSDDRVLRTGVFHPMLEEFITKRTFQQTDSLIFWADNLMAKIQGPKLYEYVVNYIANEYYEPKVMCLDKVFVHMVDNYMSEEKSPWLSDAELYRVKDRADAFRWSMCGEIGRNIIAADHTGKKRNMYSLKSPLLIVFLYSGGCDHCKKETPGMIKLYNKFNPEGLLEIFSLCTDDEGADYLKFRKRFDLPWKYNTLDTTKASLFYKKYHIDVLPEMYLLDPERKIIAKRLKPYQLEEEIIKWKEANPNWREEYLGEKEPQEEGGQ